MAYSDWAYGRFFVNTQNDFPGDFAISSPEDQNEVDTITYQILLHTALTETTKLIASDGVGGDGLGVSVAISGDMVVANAESDDNKGAAYIFVKPSMAGGILTETTKLTATDGIADDNFHSVAIDDGTIVVGVVNLCCNGAAYVFVFDAIYLPVILK